MSRLLIFTILMALPAFAADPNATLDDCEAFARANRNFYCFGVIAQRDGSWSEAQARVRTALDEMPDEPRAWWSLAYILEHEHKTESIAAYRRAADLFSEQARVDDETQVRLSLQDLLWQIGEQEEAVAELARAVAAADRSGVPQLVAWARTNQAIMADRLQRHDDAERLLVAASEPIGQAQAWLRARWFHARGANHRHQNRWQAARDAFQRAAAIRREAGLYFAEAEALYALATIARREDAREAHQRSLSAARRGGHRVVELQSRLALAALDEDRSRGRAEMLEVFVAMEDIAALTVLCESALSIATSETAAGEWGDVEPWYDRALELARRSGSHFHIAQVVAARHRYLWQTDRAGAIGDIGNTLDTIDDVRTYQLDALASARSFSMWRSVYNAVVGYLLDIEPDVAAAFGVLERMRGRVLLDELDAAAISTSGVGTHAERRAESLRAIARVQSRLLRADLAAEDRDDLLADLERHEAAEGAARAELVRSATRFAAVRASDTVELADFQALLRSDEAVLSYQLGEPGDFGGGSWLLLITRSSASAHRLPDRDALREPIRTYTSLIRARSRVPAAASVRLHELLLAPLDDTLPSGVRRLILIPDDALHGLPFGSLRDSVGRLPLALRYELSLAPSATLWARWRAAGRADGRSAALAVADPAFNASPESSVERGGTLGRQLALKRLPFALDEGRRVVQRLGRGSRLLHGERATEGELKRTELARYGVLHLAAHALVDDRRPERSGILLASGAGDGEDGLLQLREIVDLELDGSVVVLAACRSVSGEVIGSEGAMHLGRGFFVAGARAVIGTLWPLRDDDSTALFDAFYAGLARGESLRTALASAQRQRIEAGAPEAAWAGVVLIGDGQIVLQPGGRSRSALAWIAIGALGVALFVWLALKKT